MVLGACKLFPHSRDSRSLADSLVRFKTRVRSFSSSCVKGFGWFVLCSAFHVSFLLASLFVGEEHSILLISPVDSGTGIPGPCGIGFVDDGRSEYITCFLFFRFIHKMKINTSTIKSNNK